MKHTIIGHVAIDRIITHEGDSLRLGGPPSYARSVSSVLDSEIDVVTRIGPDFKPEYVDQYQSWGVDIDKWRCSQPTTGFILDYTKTPRGIGLTSICEPITLPDMPIDSVILSPITSELDTSQVTSLEADYVSLDPQGLIRENVVRDSISHVDWRPEWLGNINLLKTSLDEHYYLTGETDPHRSLRSLSRKGVETVVITMGDEGSLVYHQGFRYRVPIYPTETVDTTGAGDCFHVAIHDKLEAGEPLDWALSFGSAVSSGIVETLGPSFHLTRRDVIERAEKVQESVQKLS